MIAEIITMEIPRHVLQTYFRDTSFPLVQHHLASFNALLDTDIPAFIKASNPLQLEIGDPATPGGRRFIRIYMGGKEGTALKVTPPLESDETALVPHACRLENRTYALTLTANVVVEYEFADKSVETRTFENVILGEIPLMLRSRYCYLTAIPGETIGECKYELGGYFIIDGTERVLVTQELLGTNLFHAGTRTRKLPKGTSAALVEKDEPIAMVRQEQAEDPDLAYEDVSETYVGIKTLSEDGSRGPYSHFLVLPSATTSPQPLEAMTGNLGRDNRLVVIQLPGYSQPVPVLSVFRALGVTSDRDLYDTILAGVPDKDRILYDEHLYQIVLSHEKYLAKSEMTDLDILSSFTRSKSRAEVVQILYDMLFSNVEGGRDDPGGLFRRKAYLLGLMMKMALDVDLGRRPPSDRDNMQFKRFTTSGTLCFEEFRRRYREMTDAMLLKMDKSIQYNPNTYAGKNLPALIEDVNTFWKYRMMLNGFVSSFKGAWGGRVGIGQILARPSYLAAIHHLRGSLLQIDRTVSTAPPRRLFASQFGILCPVDSPDGSDIGYKKSLTVFARISTAFPTEAVKQQLRATGVFRDAADIHPSTWAPEWTRVYVNSDLAGVVVGDTEAFHRTLVAARRSGGLADSVSLAWMRINNEYKIFCDAGRPIRPVYREGVTAEQVKAAKSWTDLAKLVDYIDASESDSLLISLVPFHPTQPSEIHMSFNLSVAANLVPYLDHNPATRSVFSIAQQKQAASWYHTNYLKRFDTISMMATSPQRPLSQTWIYHEMMGRGGCLPYGENAIVAITMYGGHNQEDSVILNGGSLKRGMYKTIYAHSYTLEEEALETGWDKEKSKLYVKHQTKLANPLKDPSVSRKPGMNYELLDESGIIKVNSIVGEDTILVGHLSPQFSPTGQQTGYRDISMEPKRGQHGRVDAVYVYSTADGRKGVKIRIVEDRTPVIGDKMASRHSQKGTVGQILAEEDMPFTSKGIRPDLIFNPHGIPTRMTTGQFIEAASNKLGVSLGALTDATPFTTTNRIGELRVALLQRGFEPYGSEVLYNGSTGEMLDADVFMGPIYYQRLKHMVADKINSRDTGPKKLLTRQPTQGRGDEGGLRIGEMERDALLSHGMSKFLAESMMERSDKASLPFDPETGRFDTSRTEKEVPYSMALFTQELEALHVTMKMET